MPNGGPTPSCVYCQHFEFEVRRCTLHQLELGDLVVRSFCRDLNEIEGNAGWAAEEIELGTLVAATMYAWIEIEYMDAQENHHHEFNPYPLASFETYSAEVGMAAYQQLHQAQRKLYRKRGYRVIE